MDTRMINRYTLLVLVLAGLAAPSARAVTPAALKAELDAGEEITMVDIRMPSLYRAGHMAGAINIPAMLVARRRLPPVGRVIVYGRGLGTDDVPAAVRELNTKPGIQAEALDGGYAAWQMARGLTTDAPGLQTEQLNYITYQDVSQAAAGTMLLVDLRAQPAPAPGQERRQAQSLSDLKTKFPQHAVVTSPFGLQSRQGAGNTPAMVLVDSMDGSAVRMARILKANGNRRVAILAGGDTVVSRDGVPGSKRMGMGYAPDTRMEKTEGE